MVLIRIHLSSLEKIAKNVSKYSRYIEMQFFGPNNFMPIISMTVYS